MLFIFDNSFIYLLSLCFSVHRFDHSHSQGIEYLQKMGIVGQGVEAIANFLRHEPGIPKEALGQYLGDHRNQELLHAYVWPTAFFNLK
jgi:Sec7-like guanine-nucleotide exchange factor